MMKLIQSVGDAAGAVGILVCLFAGVARLGGTWSVGGVQIATLFQLGIGLMVFACLAKVQALVESQKVSGAGKQR
jgi:hypothetical protein